MVARTISQLISRSISRAINEIEGAAFDPLSLFASGAQGVWYDPSDMSTLFQDSEGTIPVTAAGQPVGLIRDKSGRGNHATQATATSRPILQTTDGKWYLAFDGVDDWMQSGSINLSSTNKITVWSGITKLSDTTGSLVCEFGINFSTQNGSFGVSAPGSGGTPTYLMASRGATTTAAVTRTGFSAPHTAVLSGASDTSAPSVALRVNTTTASPSVTAQGGGNYGNFPLYIGRRGGTSAPFNGRLFGLIIRGATSSSQQITDTESYMNSKTGAY